MSAFIVVYMVFCWCFVQIINGHSSCSTDLLKHQHHINKNVYPESLIADPRLRNQNPASTTSFSNIRIGINTDQLQSDWSSESILLPWFINDIIPPAMQWLSNAMSVRPVNGNLTFERVCLTIPCSASNALIPNWQQCGDYITIPDFMFDSELTYPQGYGLPVDIVVYFSGSAIADSSSFCSTALAFASYCHTNAYDRPIAAMINLCKNVINPPAGTLMTYEQAINLIVHEVMHGLGFASQAFPFFRKNDANRSPRTSRDVNSLPVNGVAGDTTIKWQSIRGKPSSSTAFVVLPTVVQKLQEFYGCNSVIGLELEDYNIVAPAMASHWDARIVFNDVMLSASSASIIFSIFTFALFEDSGWYQMNWDYAQESPYGKGAGCSWFDSTCITDSGTKTIDDSIFCTTTSSSCDKAHNAGSLCQVSTWNAILPSFYQYFTENNKGGNNFYNDFCPAFQPYSNQDCRRSVANQIPVNLLGGRIRADSRCYNMSSTINLPSLYCYLTHCIRNYKNIITALQFGIFNSDNSSSTWLSCSASATSYMVHQLPYYFTSYKYSVSCPNVTDVCFDESAYICNGHGTYNASGNVCICSPGFMGADCTIRMTAANLKIYSTTSNTINCSFDYDININYIYIGFLEFNIGSIDDYTTEMYFNNAYKNWIAIMLGIEMCDSVVVTHVWNANSKILRMAAYYYQHSNNEGKRYNALSTAEKTEAFNIMFESSFTYSLIQSNIIGELSASSIINGMNGNPITNSPTNNPISKSPTNNPVTNHPTTNPTYIPSSDPTTNPTYIPSSNPTIYVTESPSGITGIPTSNPSSNPTSNPSVNPSSNPTNKPTGNPTRYTKSPTSIPTGYPNINPTSKPTDYPTRYTKSPTSIPIGYPISSPTKYPENMQDDAMYKSLRIVYCYLFFVIGFAIYM